MGQNAWHVVEGARVENSTEGCFGKPANDFLCTKVLSNSVEREGSEGW